MLIDLSKPEIDLIMKSLLYKGLHLQDNKNLYNKLYNILVFGKDEDHK